MTDTLTAGWLEFYVATAGAGAALAGLVMVALSVNIKEILGEPSLTARAAAAVGSLVLVVVAAGVGLIPAQPAPVLGAELLVGTAVASLLQIRALRTMIPVEQISNRNRVLNSVLVSLQLVPILAGAVLLLAGLEAGLYWVAAGMLLTLIGSMLAAWVLMVEILR